MLKTKIIFKIINSISKTITTLTGGLKMKKSKTYQASQLMKRKKYRK
jgi:hypothetical protein